MRKLLILILATGFLAQSSTARAVDGVIEINMAVAEAGGVNGDTTADPPGFPVVLTVSGSYRLTGNLELPNANTTAIQVQSGASRSTIDLNGFAIRGATNCSPVLGSCSPLGTGAGINTASTAIGVRVRNGIVIGMGGNGVLLRGQATVRGVQAISNGGVGIGVGGRSSVMDSQAIFNGEAGIRIADSTGSFSTVGESVLADNLAVKNAIEDPSALDIEGSRATSGNVCSDGSCSARGARRFYLTSTKHNGAQALQACTEGFHMASLWEIYEVSGLEYTKIPRRGVVAVTDDDSGEGPPANGGWIRTGSDAAASSRPGQGNCMNWSDTGATGTFVYLNSLWDAQPAAGEFDYWASGGTQCTENLSVWCVED